MTQSGVLEVKQVARQTKSLLHQEGLFALVSGVGVFWKNKKNLRLLFLLKSLLSSMELNGFDVKLCHV